MRALRNCGWAGLIALAALPALGQAGAPCARCPQIQRQPYMAEFKITHVQTLADGTTITRETKEVTAVDSEGRRLSTVSMPMPSVAGNEEILHTSVHDPVENTETTWDTRTKTARVTRLPPEDQRHGCWANDAGSYRMNFGPFRPPGLPPSVPGATPGVGIGAGAGGSAGGYMVGSSTIVASIGSVTSGGSATMPATAPGATPNVPPAAIPRPAINRPVTEDLGTDVIQGVEVRGRRTTRTIPVGQIGNDRPLVTTNEFWTAPSLGGLTLRSVNESPQSGKETREAVSLTIGDPDLSVFQPPEGYQVTVDELHQVPCPQQ